MHYQYSEERKPFSWKIRTYAWLDPHMILIIAMLGFCFWAELIPAPFELWKTLLIRPPSDFTQLAAGKEIVILESTNYEHLSKSQMKSEVLVKKKKAEVSS